MGDMEVQSRRFLPPEIGAPWQNPLVRWSENALFVTFMAEKLKFYINLLKFGYIKVFWAMKLAKK